MSNLLKARLRYCFSHVEVESQQQQQQHHHHPQQQAPQSQTPPSQIHQHLPLFSSHYASPNISPSPLLDCLRFLSTLSPSASSPTHDEPWRKRLENLLWTASAAFIIYYGDFRSNLLTILASDTRICRSSFNLGLVCLMLNLAIFLYLALRLRTVKKAEERLDIIAPGAVPAITLVGFAAYVLLSHALWPIWKLLTLPMLFTLFMSVVVLTPYVVPFMNVRLDTDALRGLYIRSAE